MGLRSRHKAPTRSHSKWLNLNTESHRAASYPSGPVYLFAAGLGRPALTDEGGSGEARGSGGEGVVCHVPRGQLSAAWVMWRRHSTLTYVFLVVWGAVFGCSVRYLPQQGIKPVPPACVAQSVKHWTAREVPAHGSERRIPPACKHYLWYLSPAACGPPTPHRLVTGSACCGQAGGWVPQGCPPCLLTCAGCPANSVDVDLRESGGVVVDDHLHSGNVQAPGGRGQSAPLSRWGNRG